jgi:aminopeptidase C
MSIVSKSKTVSVSQNVDRLVDILYSEEMKELERQSGGYETFHKILKAALVLKEFIKENEVKSESDALKFLLTQGLRTACLRDLLLTSNHTLRDTKEAINQRIKKDRKAIANEAAMIASSDSESLNTNPTQTADSAT